MAHGGIAVIVAVVVLLGASAANASGKRSGGERHYRDVWGHAYKRQTNLFRDRDKNGVINLFQKNDRGKATAQRRGKKWRKGLVSPVQTGKRR